jgi:hypothetical protein
MLRYFEHGRVYQRLGSSIKYLSHLVALLTPTLYESDGKLLNHMAVVV